ncbi:hypothetical protein A2Z00_03855 [Candidatus Gottesmanbacteria bacterium RBG_13_45_10]|uniref:Uncharacterized protein n=1 Tax=Candidatus Gottesmanbacteria bacterium RBG_13_45_10 TaxID=1798370 RepID=A0A1F5ZHD8_9BACT|nr:MAG: hypothetical protein A2Z00_03855 [Candidatus Gottesmanbacteria bacterium RBG_13_45_10]
MIGIAGDAGRGAPINRPEETCYKNRLEEPVGMYVVRRLSKSERRYYRGRLMGECPRQDPQMPARQGPLIYIM